MQLTAIQEFLSDQRGSQRDDRDNSGDNEKADPDGRRFAADFTLVMLVHQRRILLLEFRRNVFEPMKVAFTGFERLIALSRLQD